MDRRLIGAVAFTACVLGNVHAAESPAGIDADGALALLRDGNARFVQGESTFPNLDQDRRCLTTDGGQHPYASILSCSDSRVPPELIFDAGIGELFTIRVAGNVADTDEIGTLEYGAGHLHTPLIVVMGHTKCGAVTAVAQGAKVHGSIPKLVDNIAPAVDTAREKHPRLPEAKFIPAAIKENVRQSMADVLRNSGEIRELVADGKVKIVGAVYDIHNGTIEWIGELPNQLAILNSAAGEAGDRHGLDDPHAAHTPERDSADTHHDAPKASAVRKPVASDPHADEHAVPAAHRVEPKSASHGTEAPHGGSEKSKPAAHRDSEPTSTTDSHGSAHDGADHKPAHSTKVEEHNAKDEEHTSAPHQSLVEKHGLLVPGLFLAAGSALSGTVVFLLKNRGIPSAKAGESKPEEKSSH